MLPTKLLFALLVAAVPLAANAQQPESLALPGTEDATRDPVDESTGLWFVELSRPPIIEGARLADVEDEQGAFRSAARGEGVRFRERFAYGTLFNGLSLTVSTRDLAAIKRLPGVKAIWPVIEINMADASAPDLDSALAMTGADVAQDTLGLSGSGVHVAVMDTGIDYDHPDLGGCFGPGCRVALGWDFVGDAFNANSASPNYNPVPVPDPDPDDCGGHGTHVAGIVGARPASAAGVKGVAPDVTFAAYRVFGCEGSTTADVMLAAMEQALVDGADVLNMSIGSPYQWPQYPTAVAADRLVKKGVVVVVSIGNSGANGLYSAGAPGVGRDVIGVAAFDNTHVRLRALTVSPDDARIGYAPAAGAPAAPLAGSFPLARTGTPASTADACSALPAGSLTGMVALIRRGTCAFYAKARNAELAGAAAVVLYNNVPGRVVANAAGSPALTIPVVTVSADEGVLMDSRIASGPATLTWTDRVEGFAHPTGGLVSSFSSYGLPPDLSFKPDLGAPGGLIFSTYPLEDGGYATLSGTSMSSPHVAGAVALLLEAAPRTSTRAVRMILQNNAKPHAWRGNPGLGLPEAVQLQGAGMIDIPAAVRALVRIAPAKLALEESGARAFRKTLKLAYRGRSALSLTLSHTPAVAVGGNTFTPTAMPSTSATVSFSRTTLKLGPDTDDVEVTVTITPPAEPVGAQYGGYVVFTATDGSGEYRVPYAGFVGDYQSIQAMTPTAFGFPWLARRSATGYTSEAQGATFTLAGEDIPYILVHLDHGVRVLSLDVFDAGTFDPWFNAVREEYVPRNGSAMGFFAFSWNGETTRNGTTQTVPNGSYVMRATILKALGDPKNPAHTEAWTSPVITLARP